MLLVAKRRWHKDSERQIVNGLPFTELLLTQISSPPNKKSWRRHCLPTHYSFEIDTVYCD